MHGSIRAPHRKILTNSKTRIAERYQLECSNGCGGAGQSSREQAHGEETADAVDRRGAHLLLQVRTRVLNEEWRSTAIALVSSNAGDGEHFKPGARKSLGVVHLIGWGRVMKQDSQPEAYYVHVWIHGIHPMLWRRFLVRSDGNGNSEEGRIAPGLKCSPRHLKTSSSR